MFNQSMSINQFVGRLVRDPVLKTTTNGKLLMSFPLAYSTPFKSDASGSTTSFLEVEAWDKLADFHAPRLKKGMQVVILGTVVENRWKDTENKSRSKMRLVARAITVSDLKRRPEADILQRAA